MADSIKDALEKSGLAVPEPKPPQRDAKKWREELPDDETLPPLFDAPALIKPTERPPAPKKRTTPP